MADLITYDPRITQKRIATTPSGRQVWVDITGDDRLAVIDRLPSRWPEVIKARELGDSIEQIRDRLRIKMWVNDDCRGECDPPCFKDQISACYAWIETELHDLAKKKATWMHL